MVPDLTKEHDLYGTVGLPKVDKLDVPLRKIVDFMSSHNFNLAQYLSRDILPVMGKIAHQIKNSDHSVQPKATETMVNFAVSSLLTNMPITKNVHSALIYINAF